jgi:predicted transcriptional regulator
MANQKKEIKELTIEERQRFVKEQIMSDVLRYIASAPKSKSEIIKRLRYNAVDIINVIKTLVEKGEIEIVGSNYKIKP